MKMHFDFVKKNEQEVVMVKEQEQLPLLYFPMLEQTKLVEHCFTTRLGGVSEGMYSSLNLSFARGNQPEAVMENYRRLAQAFGKTAEDFVCTDQTHTTNVLRVGKAQSGCGVTKARPYTDVDGLITNEPGVILSTFYADCVPLYFVDVKHKAIGLSHSGWRGTVGRMGQKTLEAMKEAFGTDPVDVYAAIGPSICKDCYEVSSDVAEAFCGAFAGHENEILEDKGNGKYQLDLWKANEIVMTEAGILSEHLAVTNICTCCNPELLFSHRASQGKRGNLGAFLMIK